jgi:hypothetical protein
MNNWKAPRRLAAKAYILCLCMTAWLRAMP